MARLEQPVRNTTSKMRFFIGRPLRVQIKLWVDRIRKGDGTFCTISQYRWLSNHFLADGSSSVSYFFNRPTNASSNSIATGISAPCAVLFCRNARIKLGQIVPNNSNILTSSMTKAEPGHLTREKNCPTMGHRNQTPCVNSIAVITTAVLASTLKVKRV